VYSIKSYNVISDYSSIYENLTVSYKDEKVENFTVSKVLFHNRGAVTLNRDDINTRNRLRIEVKSGNILDATVLQENNPSSDFKVSLDRVNKMVMIDFDYLNQYQGAVIEVIYTGLSSNGLDVVGDMKEVKGLRRLPHNLMRTYDRMSSRRLSFVSPSGFFVVISLPILILLMILIALDALRPPFGFSNQRSSCTFWICSVGRVILDNGTANTRRLKCRNGNMLGLRNPTLMRIRLGLGKTEVS
jgi:hypothetical protein